LLSDEQVTVDGTLLEAAASCASEEFQVQDQQDELLPDDPGNPTVNFQENRSNKTHNLLLIRLQSCAARAKAKRPRCVTPAFADGDSQRPGGLRLHDCGDRHGGTRRGLGLRRRDQRRRSSNIGRR
jgi:hypothetical protein